MIARLGTEDKNRKMVVKLISQEFTAFAVYEGTGSWKRKKEKAIMIEVALLYEKNAGATYAEQTFRAKVFHLAGAIKLLNMQEAVLVEFIHSENVLV